MNGDGGPDPRADARSWTISVGLGVLAAAGTLSANLLIVRAFPDAAVGATGSLLLAMVAGSAVVALFLRWPWWVATLLIVALVMVVPAVVAWGWPSWAGRIDGFSGWSAFDLVLALVATALYWIVLRRVPVR